MWQAWPFATLRLVWYSVESGFEWLAPYSWTFFLNWLSLFAAGTALWNVHFRFSREAQHFKRMVLRGFCKAMQIALALRRWHRANFVAQWWSSIVECHSPPAQSLGLLLGRAFAFHLFSLALHVALFARLRHCCFVWEESCLPTAPP